MTLLALIAIVGVARWSRMNSAMRFFCAMLFAALLGEIVALYAARKHGNNLGVYNISDVAQFALLCLYFNETIAVFKRYRIGLWLAVLSVAFGFISIVSLPSFGETNQAFMLFVGIAAMSFSFALIIQIFRERLAVKMTDRSEFWFSVALIVFWGSNLLIVPLLDSATQAGAPYVQAFSIWLLLTAVLSYLIVLTFLALKPSQQTVKK